MIFVFTIGSLYWSSVLASYQQRDWVLLSVSRWQLLHYHPNYHHPHWLKISIWNVFFDWYLCSWIIWIISSLPWLIDWLIDVFFANPIHCPEPLVMARVVPSLSEGYLAFQILHSYWLTEFSTFLKIFFCDFQTFVVGIAKGCIDRGNWQDKLHKTAAGSIGRLVTKWAVHKIFMQIKKKFVCFLPWPMTFANIVMSLPIVDFQIKIMSLNKVFFLTP